MTEREIERMVWRQIRRLRDTGEVGPAPIGDFVCEGCGEVFHPKTRKNDKGNRRRFCTYDCYVSSFARAA